MPKFGISPEDMAKLANEVSIVFNSAATIRFVEPINVAVRNNIYSISQLVEFCNELEKLEALIHLSTAYSNCHKRDTIYEMFYELPMNGDRIISVSNNLKQIQKDIHSYPNIFKKSHHLNHENDPSKSLNINIDTSNDEDDEYYDYNGAYDDESGNIIERSACRAQVFYKGAKNDGTNNMNDSETSGNFEIDKSLMEEFSEMALRQSNKPNTYTFTKAIDESYLIDLVKQLPDRYLYDKIPVCIVRPSIVSGAWREPVLGYVDNYNGPTGAILSLYMGALQAMPGEGDKVADIVPVDMVVNMITWVGWFLVNEKASKEINNCNGNHINKSNSNSNSISSNTINNSGSNNSNERSVKPDRGA